MIKNKSLFIVFAAIPLLAGCWWKKDAVKAETAMSEEASEASSDIAEEVSPCENEEEAAAQYDNTDEK